MCTVHHVVGKVQPASGSSLACTVLARSCVSVYEKDARGAWHQPTTVQPAASAVYLPSGWWHATVNVGDAVGAALQEQRLDGVDEPGAWAAALARPADFSAAWLVRRVARAVFRSLSSTFSKKYIFVRTALPPPPAP